MNQKPLTFNGLLLSIDDRNLNIHEFVQRLPTGTATIPDGKAVHCYQFDYESNYLKIQLGDGAAMPWNPNVINLDTMQSESNPRQTNQAETRESFALIDFDNGYLWISNIRKKRRLVAFLSSRFNARVVAKDIYNEEEFKKALKRLDELKISAVPTLFSQLDTLPLQLADGINHYEAVAATLRLEYKGSWIGAALFEKISALLRERRHYDGIVISGRDEKGLGLLFNTEGFTRRIEIRASTDSNGMFEPDDVFIKLIQEIENEKR